MGVLADDIIKLLSSLIWYLMEDQALELWILKKKRVGFFANGNTYSCKSKGNITIGLFQYSGSQKY